MASSASRHVRQGGRALWRHHTSPRTLVWTATAWERPEGYNGLFLKVNVSNLKNFPPFHMLLFLTRTVLWILEAGLGHHSTRSFLTALCFFNIPRYKTQS